MAEAASAEDLWEDANAAQKIFGELNRVRTEVENWQSLERESVDLQELIELAAELADDDALLNVPNRLGALEKALAQVELTLLLSGPYDNRNAIIELHPGAGGVDSQDWAAMLMRMYSRWAENSNYQVEVLDYLPGDEAGLKSVSLLIKGELAYGYLQAERGVHRLVRLSP